MALNINHGRII